MRAKSFFRAVPYATLTAFLLCGSPWAAAQTPNPADSAYWPADTLATVPTALPRKPHSRPPAPLFSGTLTLGTLYDNNILDYSSREVALLEAGAQPARFAIKTPDDVVYGAELQLDFKPTLWLDHPSRLRLSGSGDLYSRNGIENQGEVGLEWRQLLSRKITAAAEFDYLPYFYVRNLYVRDPAPGPQYAQARLRRWRYATAFSYRFSPNLDAELRYAFETRDYNATFNERDSKSHIPGVEIDYRFSRLLKMDIAYDFDRTLAEGRNSPDSQVVDISNRAHQFAWDIFLRPRIWRKHAFQAAQRVVYELQKYTSERSLDRYHFGRTDHEWHVRTAVSLQCTRWLEVGAAYTLETATVTNTQSPPSSNAIPPGEVGSFRRHTVGANLAFPF